ncbi:3-hydroxyisobutyrate dehydrogenase [Pandoraea terrae]|uniref:3-hydroxyisobutyrate dehydrogenase n=1 Tax=Pandoraea terrae TaxID=1537710 RepID=A0A5E4XIZ8_9BURK|nr:NAD(P)-dependent oxidoreductase [Pandoraea terrae]VVE36130.1 3-hydroxyisobutyrate dehydrogenase [Pandoraea terrae]
MKIIGVVGLGNMGRGMALSLQRGGFTVLGYDPSPAAARTLAEAGIGIRTSVAALAKEVDALVLSLPTSQVVEAVVNGADGIAANGRRGLLVIDTSTADPASTRKLAAQLDEAGIALIDAPVSGGPKGALNGALTMVLGGSAEDVARAEPVLAAMSAKRVHIGDVGAGHVTKLINNLMCASHLLIAGEAMRLAEAAGVSPARVLEGVNAGSGRSGVTQTNYPTWILNDAFDSGFTMKLMRKDVRLAMNLAEATGTLATAPFSAQAGRLWAASAESVADDEDFNRIVQFIEGRKA